MYVVAVMKCRRVDFLIVVGVCVVIVAVVAIVAHLVIIVLYVYGNSYVCYSGHMRCCT